MSQSKISDFYSNKKKPNGNRRVLRSRKGTDVDGNVNSTHDATQQPLSIVDSVSKKLFEGGVVVVKDGGLIVVKDDKIQGVTEVKEDKDLLVKGREEREMAERRRKIDLLVKLRMKRMEKMRVVVGEVGGGKVVKKLEGGVLRSGGSGDIEEGDAEVGVGKLMGHSESVAEGKDFKSALPPTLPSTLPPTLPPTLPSTPLKKNSRATPLLTASCLSSPVRTPTKRPRQMQSPLKLLHQFQSPPKKPHHCHLFSDSEDNDLDHQHGRQLKEVIKRGIKAPPSPCKTPVFSPVKEVQPPKLPAHQRFKHLASSTTSSTILTLPHSYQALHHTFTNLDLVISILTNRHEICTFQKVKSAVDKMDKSHSLSEEGLGQVVGVDEQLYHLRQEKHLPTFGGGRPSNYTLTIEPTFHHVTNDTIDVTNKSIDVTNKSIDVTDKSIDVTNHITRFPCSMLGERKARFRKRLVQVVMKHHKDFLACLRPPVEVEGVKIKRWHPRFPLHQLPPLPSTPLPQPPNSSAPITTASMALQMIKGPPDPKIKGALEKIMKAKAARNLQPPTPNSPTPNSPTPNSPTSNSPNPNSPTPKAATKNRGISQSLLDKIRKKESVREAEVMVGGGGGSRRAMLERMPVLAKIIRQFFMQQKRPAVPHDDVIKCMADSYRCTLSTAEASSHLQLLMEVAPDWISCLVVRKGRFVKLNHTIQMNDLYERLKGV